MLKYRRKKKIKRMNKGAKRSMRIEETRSVPKTAPMGAVGRHWAHNGAHGRAVGRRRAQNGARGRALGAPLERTAFSYAFWLNFTWYKSWNLGHLEETGRHENTHFEGTFERLEELEEPWDLLGIKWGSLERFGYSSFVVVISFPYSSPLFNALFHSFRVCFICIYV